MMMLSIVHILLVGIVIFSFECKFIAHELDQDDNGDYRHRLYKIGYQSFEEFYKPPDNCHTGWIYSFEFNSDFSEGYLFCENAYILRSGEYSLWKRNVSIGASTVDEDGNLYFAVQNLDGTFSVYKMKWGQESNEELLFTASFNKTDDQASVDDLAVLNDKIITLTNGGLWDRGSVSVFSKDDDWKLTQYRTFHYSRLLSMYYVEKEDFLLLYSSNSFSFYSLDMKFENFENLGRNVECSACRFMYVPWSEQGDVYFSVDMQFCPDHDCAVYHAFLNNVTDTYCVAHTHQTVSKYASFDTLKPPRKIPLY